MSKELVNGQPTTLTKVFILDPKMPIENLIHIFP